MAASRRLRTGPSIGGCLPGCRHENQIGLSADSHRAFENAVVPVVVDYFEYSGPARREPPPATEVGGTGATGSSASRVVKDLDQITFRSRVGEFGKAVGRLAVIGVHRGAPQLDQARARRASVRLRPCDDEVGQSGHIARPNAGAPRSPWSS